MTLSINDVLIEQNELTLAEFLVLLPIYLKVDTHNVDRKALAAKGLLRERYKFNFDTQKLESNGFALMDMGSDMIRNILLDSDKTVAPVDNLLELAKQMQELFPKGKKETTNYYWRGNTPEIIRKLQIFFKRYGDVSNEQMLEATKNYVESFQDSNSPYMQLLKYFIWKDKTDGSQESALLSYIENYSEDEVKPANGDWTVTLK